MPHKLLLADDSVTIQRVIELTFADEDIDVMAVSDGALAIEAIKRETPDIVLADASMPEKDGYEVASFVKGDPTRAHVPVVLLTGAFESVDEFRADAIGCDGVLVKPFEPRQVIGKVKELLVATTQDAGEGGGAPAGVSSEPAAVSFEPVRERGASEPVSEVSDAVRPGPVAAPMPSPEVTDAAGASSAPDTSTAGRTADSVLAQAFATFLAVEQGAPVPALPVTASASEPSGASLGITEEVLESLVDRVIERMTDSVVRETTAGLVSQVAERLVRDEIDRIKAAAN